jgi:uncharacterized protein with HEPN domain
MKHEVKTWLFDILQSIEEIESYFSDKPKKFEDYLSDTKTQRAVERNIEIIGEAVSRVVKQILNSNLTMLTRSLVLATESFMDMIKYPMR